MRTMTFQINDATTDTTTNPAVFVTISENTDGTLNFAVTQQGSMIGDLRGLFFDVNAVADGALANSLSISAASAASFLKTGDDSISDLGEGSVMKGLTSSTGDRGFDAGINIGTAGIGTDDIRSFSFTLGSSARGLTLDDFANVDFGVRLTSVGTLGSTRANSSKILEVTNAAIKATDDASSMAENNAVTGNLLANDPNSQGATVTAWSGGTLGSAIVLNNAAGATLTVNADGTYTLDATSADALSAGETITQTFTYNNQVTNPDQTSSASASFTVTVTGVNVTPVAANDAAATSENAAAATGSVLTNDRDVDRLDTLSVSALNGQTLGQPVAINNGAGATFTLNADGTYSLDASQADALSAGETITQAFAYTLSDNHGATTTATVNVSVTGTNDAPVAANDAAATSENAAAATGSVLANDRDIDRLDTLSVSALDGQTLGQPVAINNGAGATFTLNADGTYSLDASQADALSAGETITQAFTYTLSDNHGATTTATVNVSVTGTNDAPVARNDAYQVQENAAVTGSVLVNDSDVDHLDVISVSSVNGQQVGTIITLDSGAMVLMNADGTFTYNTNGAFDYLNTGESATDSFQYTINDGHGGLSTAVASVVVAGISPVTPPPPVSDPISDRFPTMEQNISNVVLYLDDGIASTPIQKIKLQPEGLSLKDVDLLNIDQFIASHGSVVGENTNLVGISIHAGTTYPDADYTAHGEGVFYFLNDSTPIAAVGTKVGTSWTEDWTKDDIPLSQAALDVGISTSLLGVQAQTVYNHFDQATGAWSL